MYMGMSSVFMADCVDVTQNESVMASELVARGPLSIAINAELLQFYHSGVWDPIGSCDPSSLDHGKSNLN